MAFGLWYNVFMEIRVKAYAKLNLTLAVTGVRDGYHMLDSLVCTVDMFDLIKLKRRKDKLVSVEMHGRGTETLPYEKNNAVKAAEAFIKTFDTCGTDIKIFKNIPVGAGLGGSSADISGVINGMARLYGAGGAAQLKQLADSLGSDTGYLLNGGYARLEGRGEIVRRLDVKTKLNFLLLAPKSGVSTADCYRLSDAYAGGNFNSDGAVSALFAGDAAALGACMRNDLYAPAVRLNPDVEKAYNELAEFAPCGVCMTGSGSGVFALFESAEMCAYAKSRYRGKFECIQLKSVVPKI